MGAGAGAGAAAWARRGGRCARASLRRTGRPRRKTRHGLRFVRRRASLARFRRVGRARGHGCRLMNREEQTRSRCMRSASTSWSIGSHPRCTHGPKSRGRRPSALQRQRGRVPALPLKRRTSDACRRRASAWSFPTQPSHTHRARARTILRMRRASQHGGLAERGRGMSCATAAAPCSASSDAGPRADEQHGASVDAWDRTANAPLGGGGVVGAAR